MSAFGSPAFASGPFASNAFGRAGEEVTTQSGVSRLLRSQDALRQRYIEELNQKRIQEEEDTVLIVMEMITRGLI